MESKSKHQKVYRCGWSGVVSVGLQLGWRKPNDGSQQRRELCRYFQLGQRLPALPGVCPEPLGSAWCSRTDTAGCTGTENGRPCRKIVSYAGNEVIAVDGWVDTGKPTYPTNPAPWNSGIWFHDANEGGWVSYPGVRGEPVATDPTGHADGGLPAPTPADCQETYPPN